MLLRPRKFVYENTAALQIICAHSSVIFLLSNFCTNYRATKNNSKPCKGILRVIRTFHGHFVLAIPGLCRSSHLPYDNRFD